ncbi:hypothetical protein FYF76_01735 [Vibrio cholerae]|nr:hypothetical protein [Vibrio cholerae]RNE81178.1 hypothetical protein EEJ35_00340 [Vibrio cholerae]
MDCTPAKRELPLNLIVKLNTYCAISGIRRINKWFVTDCWHSLVDNMRHFYVFYFSPRLG